MNAPLIDRTSTDKVSKPEFIKLEAALKCCHTTTQDIRSAMIKCRVGEHSSVEERLAVAAAHIVCTPGPGKHQHPYAESIRGDLLATEGTNRALARHYSQLAVDAMTAIVTHLGNMAHEEKLRMEYTYSIQAEKALLKELKRERVSA